MKKLFSPTGLLIMIVLLAAVLRLWQLGSIPGGVHSDETSYGYNAYSILHTGHDEHGKPFPLILRSWGDYKPALYAYLTIPWIAVFNLTPFAIRITSALFGIASIFMLYIVTKKLLNNQKIALLAAFFLAISPWHISFSRTVSEVVVSLFFLLMLVFSLLKLREKFQFSWGAVALISGILSMDSYTASRFFVILMAIIFTVIFTHFKNKRIILWSTGLGLIGLFLLTGVALSMIDSGSRFNQISVFSSPETRLVLEEEIRENRQIPPLFTRLVHNKVINYSQTVIENYSQYFTTDFFFLHGGLPKRMQLPNEGLFYLWQLPFFLAGLYVLLRKKSREGFFLLAWWLVLLFPASLTTDETPNVYRSLVVIFPLIIIMANGAQEVFSLRFLRKIKMPLLILLMIIGLWEFVYYQNQYYVHGEVHQPWYRDYAYEPLMQYVGTISSKYKQIVITKNQSGADIGIRFWSKYDPAMYQKEGSPGDESYKGFGKYIFNPYDCPLRADAKNVVHGKVGILYINRGSCKLPSQNVRLLKVINWQDGNPAFQLLEYVPNK